MPFLLIIFYLKMCKGKAIKTECESEVADDGEGNLKNFKLTAPTIKKLEDRSVKVLFPSQYMTFKHIYGKKDVIAQIKTRTGKTLAFSLPVMQRLPKSEVKLQKRRKPKVIVMTPTRELVGQIAKDFESLIWTDLVVLQFKEVYRF